MFKTYRTAYFSFSARRELLVGATAIALALTACGQKGEPIGASNDGGATSNTASDASASGTNTSTGTTSHANVSPSATVSPDTDEPPGDGGAESSSENEHEAGAGADAMSGCGGDGQACCARATCDEGLVCIDEPSSEDGGIVVFDGGRNNQAFLDGGSFDAAVIGPFPSVDAAAALDAGSEPASPVGVCAPCGGVDERCCAQDSCDDGLSCESSGFGPNAQRSCVDDGCGAVGQNCCESNGGAGGFGGGGGGVGECDEGLTCDNPRGEMLDNSECKPTVESDGGETEDGGEPNAESDAATEECGGLDQACCPGMGGQCDDGLECDRRPPQGIEGNVCIEN